MALGAGQGRYGLQFGEPRNIEVFDVSTEVLSKDDAMLCEYIAIINDSDEVMYLSFGDDAYLNMGIRLNASGGAIVWEGQSVPKTIINAICASGSKNICLQVGS